MMLHNPPLTIVATVPMVDLLNANQRNHWANSSPKVKTLREQGGWLMRERHKGRNYYFERCHINCTVYFPAKDRNRDTMNYYPTSKAHVDGFIDGKLAPNDHEGFVIGPHLWPTAELSGIRGVAKFVYQITHLDSTYE
ncbi:RusA-like Holliday junction resolvase [Arthrobacter phage DrYang]|uniref:RusA-like resolvase n=1 Tax=Arthrobacter phage DrYang TaxID=2686080 RepID=A0A6B9J7D5_9CAUD|nr:RusA-like Holliday junction resolvase [Arthrobacter phage DrYang]QGZ17190.1 RusA-like resolvase [Arthrobacter phage DrYang]